MSFGVVLTIILIGYAIYYGGLLLHDLFFAGQGVVTEATMEEEERLARAKKQAAIARAAKTGIQENWSGTNYFGGGLTTLAERGTELVEMNNSSFLVNSQTLANLPKGARILNNSQTRKSLSSRVSSLKERIKNISNSNSKTIIGGDTITINITGNSANPTDIARVVKRVIEVSRETINRTISSSCPREKSSLLHNIE